MRNNSCLTGYTHCCGKITGGIRSVALIEKCGIAGMTFDRESGTYTGIDTVAPGGFKTYRFREGAAVYSETLRREKGVVRVDHSLEFSMDKTDERSARSISEFIGASLCGMVAVITTSNGTQIVAGYSEEFAGERPLKISLAEATSGKNPADKCPEKVVLESCDSHKARLFTGSIA